MNTTVAAPPNATSAIKSLLMRRPPSNQLMASCPLHQIESKPPNVPASQASRSTLLLTALLCGSCDGRDTGSFEEQSANNLIAWSQANPHVSDETWAGVESLTCQVSSAKRCGPDDCQAFKPVTFVRWHPATKRYERCGGDEPCDSYMAQVSYSGSFANIAVPESAMMARLTAGGEFMEVLTQMDAVIIYHGNCRPTRG